MATQKGPIMFEGTIGNMTGYEMNGKHFLKMKSSVSRRRILQSDRFSNTRRNANWFAAAQKIAAEVYRVMPLNERGQHLVWYPMRNRAQELVRRGLDKEEIICRLKQEFMKREKERTISIKPSAKIKPAAHEIPDEIILGRAINRRLEPSLVDQLVAARLFVNKVLNDKKDETEYYACKMRSRLLEKLR